MIPACDRRTVRRSDGQTESIIAKTALCIASYADALSIKLLDRVRCSVLNEKLKLTHRFGLRFSEASILAVAKMPQPKKLLRSENCIFYAGILVSRAA